MTTLLEVMTELAGLAEALSQSKIAEHKARIRGFYDSDETSIAGRERDAKLASEDFSVAVIEVTGQIESLKEHKEALRLLLDG